MEVSYGDCLVIGNVLNEVMRVALPKKDAVTIATFAETIQEVISTLEDKRGEWAKLSEEERDINFFEFLKKTVALPEIKFGEFEEVRYSPSFVMTMRRFGLF